MDDEYANIRAKADEFRARGGKLDKRLADLMERLISDNEHSAKIRKWLRAVLRGRSLEQQVTLMASMMAESGRRDEWDKSTLKARKAHADKLSKTARNLADIMGEDIRPRYCLESYLYSVGFKTPEPPANVGIQELMKWSAVNSVKLDFPALLIWLADHVAREADARATTNETRGRNERITARDLEKKLNDFFGESPSRVIAACVSIMFTGCNAKAEDAARWLGRR